MKDENRFFRWVWRINGLLLLGALLLTVSFFGFTTGYEMYLSLTQTDRMAEFRTQWEPKTHYSLELAKETGAFGDDISERIYQLDEVTSDRLRQNDDVTTARNLLVIDEKAGTSRWLFEPGKKKDIVDLLWIYDFARGESRDAGVHIFGIAVVIAENDTNKDGNVDENDRQALYFYRLDGKPPVKVLSADKIELEFANWQNAKLRVLCQEGKSSFAVSYLLPGLVEASRVPIAGLPSLSKPANRITKIGFTGVISEPKNTD